MAALIQRYHSEVDAFNATDHPTDKDSNAHATYQATIREMIGVPARSAEDALAAIDFFIKEGADLMIELGGGDDHDTRIEELIALVADHVVARAAFAEAARRRPGKIVILR